jgi:hypothetical protein
MQPGGPFTLIAELGSSQLGSVWSGIGPDGQPATVAVLNASVANDKKWRDAFAAAATALVSPEGDKPRFLSGNFSASAPWAAFAANDGPGAEVVFQTLGVEYRPAPPSLAAPATTSPATAPAQAAFTPPTIAPPAAAPTTGQFGSPILPDADPDPRSRRRAGPWIGVAVVAVLVAATMVVAWRAVAGIAEPAAQPTTAAPPAAATSAAPRPGREPPLPGGWPSSWPKFKPPPDMRTLTLDGLSFTFVAPVTWSCSPRGSAAGSVSFTCRAPIGNDEDIGGELTVRDCPSPCDDEVRASMRAPEDAWGEKWRFAGNDVTIAETHNFNGRPEHYALVLIANFASKPDGAVDRQLVMRMDAPEDWLNDIRKFANSLRDAVKF